MSMQQGVLISLKTCIRRLLQLEKIGRSNLEDAESKLCERIWPNYVVELRCVKDEEVEEQWRVTQKTAVTVTGLHIPTNAHMRKDEWLRKGVELLQLSTLVFRINIQQRPIGHGSTACTVALLCAVSMRPPKNVL